MSVLLKETDWACTTNQQTVLTMQNPFYAFCKMHFKLCEQSTHIWSKIKAIRIHYYKMKQN